MEAGRENARTVFILLNIDVREMKLCGITDCGLFQNVCSALGASAAIASTGSRGKQLEPLGPAIKLRSAPGKRDV